MKRAANQIQIVGNLGAAPTAGTAGNGTPYLYFSLAEDGKRKINPDTKQKEKQVRWHDCVAWGESLTKLLKDLGKGEPLLVQGQLDYDIKMIDGKERKLPKIIVQDFLYMSPKRTS